MSMSFEIFPTKEKKPSCNEIIKYSVKLFNQFLEKEKILRNVNIIASEVTVDNEICTNPAFLTLEVNHHTVFKLNEEGEVYAFYHELTELDKDFWNEEVQENKNAQSMEEKIGTNQKIGYFWSVKRTIGQPAIVSLYYGYLATAIAVLTEGIIYSDDGAWDYSRLPIEGKVFETEYLDVENIGDIMVKNNIERWLSELKRTN